VENAKVSSWSLVFKTLAGALAVIALAHTAQAQGVISERNVSTQLARAIADACHGMRRQWRRTLGCGG